MVLPSLSTLAFALAALMAIHAVRAGRWGALPTTFAVRGTMLVGLALQSAALYLRGQALGRCPLGGLADVLLFVAWSIVLLYFLVGPAFHLSLLGLFSAPMVALLQLAAIALGRPDPSSLAPRPLGIDPWLESHAALSLIAYGAFGLAAVAGLMFLIQDQLLRRHRIHHLALALPPISFLGRAITRLYLLGFLLLSVGIASAFFMQEKAGALKLALSSSVWLLYGTLLTLHSLGLLTPPRRATLAIASFTLTLITLAKISGYN